LIKIIKKLIVAEKGLGNRAKTEMPQKRKKKRKGGRGTGAVHENRGPERDESFKKKRLNITTLRGGY